MSVLGDTAMDRMFEQAAKFNQPLDAWHTGSAKTLVAVFSG